MKLTNTPAERIEEQVVGARVHIEKLEQRIAALEDLLRWVAPKIRVRNANGLMMDNKCALCSRTSRERVQRNGYWVTEHSPCRHEEIFAFLK